MSPKRPRQQSKTVTIYNSKSLNGNAKKDKKCNAYEQSRNNAENWEFHFKSAEIDKVKGILKCKDLSGVPLIIGAVVLNQADILDNLLKHGYNVNDADKNNMTPLCWAVKLKQVEMIRSLLSNKADPSVKPNNGDDVLFMALGSSLWNEDSFVSFWKELKTVGRIDVNATNKNGLSMLHLAVRRDWIDFVDILISEDVNINATNSNGVTPLMLASYRNDYNIVSRLIAKGANVKRRNSDGFTALCYAFSAATVKNLSPPYLVVEKLRAELERNKLHLVDYLKDRLKIVVNPLRKSTADQPNVEQMFQHILVFVMRNIEGGFRTLWSDLQVAYVVKDALEKRASDKEHVKLLLSTLCTLVKVLPHCVSCVDATIGEGFVKSGCLVLAFNILRKYVKDDGVAYLAFAFMVTCCAASQEGLRWLEANREEFAVYTERVQEIGRLSDVAVNDYKLVQEKLDELNRKLSKVKNDDETEFENFPANKVAPESKPSTKKCKRRTKAMKAKLAKIKTAELAERYNTRKPAEPKCTIEEPAEETAAAAAAAATTSIPEEENACVNAIKNAIGILDEDNSCAEKSKATGKNVAFCKNDWITTIQNLPFRNYPKLYKPLMQEFYTKCKYLNVDLVIKYLEGLLEMIVNKYKVVWELDKPFEKDQNSESEYDVIIEPNVEAQQNAEKEQLRVVHREFYNLTRNIRQYYDKYPERSQQLLKELEKLLITHSVRGETILKEVAACEEVKINVTMPVDFDGLLPKYMERVINGEMEELDDVNIQVIEHLSNRKVGDGNGMGDYLYLNEISSMMAKNCDCNDAVSTSSKDYYHLASSILNICDDNDDDNHCCNKGCSEGVDVEESKDSRWCSLLRSLEMMEDCQKFFGGKIRISNIEKRKSHVLSPSGNFAALEIGLGHDGTPLAVKFVPKNDAYATLLKQQVDQILDLRHKNILHYYTCAYDVGYLVVATPLCEYNLGQYVLKMKHTQMKICKVSIIQQILGGLMFLHDHDEPIVHGNLKPSNVLVDVHGNIRIAEFGVHKALVKLKNLPESTVIWFATETYRQYKQSGTLECTCASDIQVAGMLVHFAVNNGSHPFGKDVPDILKNLEKASPQILSKDMELYDLLTWMLLGEPGERPTIHQVMSHIFFWSNKKKWRYILACSGIGAKSIPLDLDKLHAALDKTAIKENIMGNCWVLTAKKQYPQAIFIDNDAPSGLLKFIKFVVEHNLTLRDGSGKPLSTFILTAFPYFALSLYRMIENTEWSDHRIFMPFHTVVDY